ncbi:MAG: polysaccharide biosynthesis tyrosine autokinase [Pegethrix bostrychoides GSE-TBD4-15B]|uniref:Polysaccharide biosynthesis tyrosine autokinase n=1 Tax=Pegethrix bostrychoides GSE-TBD4-15B TaxID=2839662 RepID=A0A951U779_9CYAN|nr:polysaccharide biosynthesis tyrosine autokinase [Pegethrix bostrychoides GSE-TBD4-15B]
MTTMTSSSHLQTNASPEIEFGYGQLLRILLRRLPWMLAALTASLSAAMLYTAIKPPTYESSMQLLVEPNYQEKTKTDSTANITPRTDREDEVDYATQLNLMRSVVFIERALKPLQSEYPDLEVDTVQEQLKLTQLTEDKVGTKIFEISYADSDPVKVQQILNSIQKVYQDYNLEQQKLRLEKGLKFIDEQIAAVQKDLYSSQRDLEAFRQQQRLIDPKEEATTAAASLNNIKQERQTAETEYRDASARYSQLQREMGMSAQTALAASRLTQSPRIQSLFEELQKTELELEQTRLTYTDTAQPVVKLVEQRQGQIALLQQEMGRVVEAVPTGSQILRAGQLSATDVKQIETFVELRTSLFGLSARLQSLTQTERQLQAQLQRFPTLIANYDRLEPDVETKRGVLQALIEQRQKVSAELAGGGFNWQIVEPAKLGEFVGPKLLVNLVLGTVIGLFLGGVAAFLRESMDDSLRSVEELQQELRRHDSYQTLSILGVIPKLPHHRQDLTTLMAIQSGQCRESLDLIYKNMEFLRHKLPLKSSLKSLVITSAGQGEGKSLVALGLALSAARAHQRVLLIDGNLRQPHLHQQFMLANTQGLSGALRSGDLPVPLELAWGNVRVDLLTAGSAVSDPMQILSSPQMHQLLRHYESDYDLVLVDTVALLGSADALQTASCCDGVLLVTQLNQANRQALSQALALLQPLNLVGLVVNGTRLAANLSAPEVKIPVQVHPAERPDMQLEVPSSLSGYSGSNSSSNSNSNSASSDQ